MQEKLQKILNTLKDLVITLRDKPEDLKADERFRSAWLAKNTRVQDEVKNLSGVESEELDREYQKWYKEEIAGATENSEKDLDKSEEK